MKHIILITLIAVSLGCSAPQKELDNIFYPFNNALTSMPNAPQGFDNQAEFVKRLGFDGYGGHSRDDYFKRWPSLDMVGLSMPELYWGMNLDSAGNVTYDKMIKEIIKDSKDRNLVVTFIVKAEAFENNQAEGDPLVVKAIQELADFAAPYGVKLAVYPHVNVYCETTEHSLRLAKLAKRNNVGSVFNLCHLLKKEGAEGWEQKLDESLPYLYMLSICGADAGNTKEMGWNQLIQPLGEGSFDTYSLVKYAKNKGYEGPIGLQCYNIKQDCEVALTTSMNTWRSYQKRYAEETE